MQQTAYAQARSKDPRNQIYGIPAEQRASLNPLQRPAAFSSGSSANPAAMYTAPTQTYMGGGQLTTSAAVPTGLEDTVAQAQQDQNAMINPSMMQRAQELLASRQGQPQGSLAGIDIGAPEQASASPDLSTDQGVENAGLSPRLPVTPPEPIISDESTYTQPQVDQSKKTVSTIFDSQAPDQGVRGATASKDKDRLTNDMQKIAESKNPQSTWQDLQKQPFYQNSSFYTGLMGVGLSIMSGRDPLEAFQVGSAMADQDDMKKQLGANRQALIDQGYSADSVANAIAQGDPRLMKMRELSPEAAAQMQDEREQKRYERNRADQLADQETQAALTLKRDEASDRRYQQRADDQLRRSKELIDYRDTIKQNAAKAEADNFNFGSRDINAEKSSPEGSNVKQWSTKRGYFTAADKEHQLAQDAIARYNKTGKESDRQDATAAFKQLIFNLARGEIGENRSLQGSDLAEFAEDPSIPVRTINDIKLKSGFTPTLDALRYVKAGIDTGIKSMDYNIDNAKEQRIRANAITLGPKRATALVNRAFGGGFHDPLNAFSKEAQDLGVEVRRSGGLSGYDEDPSWMTAQ